MTLRWGDYKLIKDDEIDNYFTKTKIDKEKCLFIMGCGFDDRMCDGLEKLVRCNKDFDIWSISYNEGEDSPSKNYAEKSKANMEKFGMLTQHKNVVQKNIDMWVKDENGERYVAEINTNIMVKNNISEFEKYSDIIIDISAMPQAIYICLVSRVILSFIDSKKIFVMINENYRTDMTTIAIESDEFAHDIHGFIGTSVMSDDVHIVWFPVLGETNKILLQKYYDYLTSEGKNIDEICPVVPYPSVDAKRADKIIKEYRKQLFSQWEIDKKNIVYASENNPFQIYRKLYNSAEHYSNVLKPIGKCKFVFSTITSKIMTVGTLLAAIELKEKGFNIGFLNIKNKGYTINVSSEEVNVNNRMYCLCLSDDGF